MDLPACELCGCTELDACEGGCGWDGAFAVLDRAVCTRCAPIVAAIAVLGIPPRPYVLLPGQQLAELPA